jgi:hypothetical protein
MDMPSCDLMTCFQVYFLKSFKDIERLLLSDVFNHRQAEIEKFAYDLWSSSR